MDCSGAPLWVCEDDIAFLEDGTVVREYIEAFLRSDADVLCLGYNSYKHMDYDAVFYRTVDCQTTPCYIIKSPAAMADLKKLWSEVLVCRQSHTTHPYERMYNGMMIHNQDFYCADQCWKILQQRYKFVIPKRRCVYQREGYSDIEQRIVNYRC